MCFGGSSSSPAPQPLPPAPSRDSPETLARVATEKQKAMDATGQQATILTSGLGASQFGDAGTVAKPGTVLGSTA